MNTVYGIRNEDAFQFPPGTAVTWTSGSIHSTASLALVKTYLPLKIRHCLRRSDRVNLIVEPDVYATEIRPIPELGQ